MIKINLDNDRKNKINSLMIDFINENKIYGKVNELSNYLNTKGYKKTAKLLNLQEKTINDNDIKENSEKNWLFLLFGRSKIQKCIDEFEKNIEIDCQNNNVVCKIIKDVILNGRGQKKDNKTNKVIQKKIHGFIDMYTTFSDSSQAYDILEILGLNVCPYCNRQYTFTINSGKKTDKDKTRPQFDHFYPKSIYPYLAISIYNLIPSCPLCNKGKLDLKPDNILYPYEESFDDKGIRFEIQNIIPNMLNKEDIKVELTPHDKYTEIIKAYNKNFKIEPLYNKHRDYISEILQKKHIFSDEAIESIYNSYNEIFDSSSQVKQLIFGTYEPDKLSQRPLSKLTKDILKQIE